MRRITRRDFITLVGGGAAWPIAAHAQQASKAARIGYLAFRSPISADDAFLKGLFELGWVEGQNIVIERRFAVGNAEQLKGSAAELVRLKVDVIVTAASAPTKVAKEATASIPIVFANAGDPVGQGFVQSLPRPGGNVTGIAFDASPDITAKTRSRRQCRSAAALAAKAATTTVPIVFATGGDPVRDGLVASLNRPGGNATGISFVSAEVGAKQLGLLHELQPGVARRIAMVVDPKWPITEPFVSQVRAAASAMGQQMEVLYVSSGHEIETAFTTLVQRGAGALHVGIGGCIVSQSEAVGSLGS